MEIGIYVSPEKGHMVQRFGAPPGTYWGVGRVDGELVWSERIFAIPLAEYQRYQSEYDGAVNDKGLRLRKRDEYEAQEKVRVEQKKKAKAEAEAATEAAAKESKPAKEHT
jgi:hypothetical protein